MYIVHVECTQIAQLHIPKYVWKSIVACSSSSIGLPPFLIILFHYHNVCGSRSTTTTSPNVLLCSHRWQQRASWPAPLPGRARLCQPPLLLSRRQTEQQPGLPGYIARIAELLTHFITFCAGFHNHNRGSLTHLGNKGTTYIVVFAIHLQKREKVSEQGLMLTFPVQEYF